MVDRFKTLQEQSKHHSEKIEMLESSLQEKDNLYQNTLVETEEQGKSFKTEVELLTKKLKRKKICCKKAKRKLRT